MAEQCEASEDEAREEDARDERERSSRIESYYQDSAWELAERIVDLEDELGADVDGICTGMHADVAEARAEIGRLEGDCVRLSEDLYEARATNAELAKDVRDGAHWEGVADRMRDEISRLDELLRYEHNRANSAIDREDVAKQAAEESREEADRLRSAWRSARRRANTARGAWRAAQHYAETWRRASRNAGHTLGEVLGVLHTRSGESDRYRYAWLSARRRAADEANFATEALALRDEEIRRLTAASND